MNSFRDLPVKRKLLLGILAICGSSLAIICGALFWFQSVIFRNSFVVELESLGAVLAQSCATTLTFDDKKSAVEVLSAVRVKPQVISASIIDAQGKFFARFGQEDPGDLLPWPPADGQVRFRGGYAYIRLPIPVLDAAPGRLQIRARFADQFRNLLTLYAALLAAVLVGALAVILLLSTELQRVITEPLIALATVAREVSEKGDFSTRAKEGGRDEVGFLTRTFNRMLEQIQSRDLRLQESREQFEAALDATSDGLWDWNVPTGTVYYSPQWIRLLGYQPVEVSQSVDFFMSLLHPEDVVRTTRVLNDHLEGRTPAKELEVRLRSKSGGYRWYLDRGKVVQRDAKGAPLRMVGTIADITERKRTEREIAQARKKFESLVNSIHCIVWEADPATLHLTFLSDQSEFMLGYPARLWLQDPGFWQKACHPADRSLTLDACKMGLAGKKPFQFEHRIVASDQRVVWLRESVSLELEGDRVVRLRGVGIDITDQKVAAEQIMQMQRELVVTSRQAGMAEVATGVLHNVGNVLNSVNVASGQLATTLRKSSSGDLRRVVGLLRQHPSDLGDYLVRDPKGRQIPTFLGELAEVLEQEREISLAELESLTANVDHIKQIVAMQQGIARSGGLKELVLLPELFEQALAINLAALELQRVEIIREFSELPPVLVDRHRVLQILINLINNAKHAMGDNDTVAQRLTLRVRPDRDHAGYVLLEVSDTGMGIRPEHLHRLFAQGFTTKKNGHGFGLHSGALAAKSMGGALEVHSEGEGRGATFSLQLPIVEPLKEPVS